MTVDDRTGLERMLAYLDGESPGGIVEVLEMRPTAMEFGRVSFTATTSEAHVNAGNTVHGGYITTLLDTAMGCAAISVLPAGKTVTTLELKVTFLRAVLAETRVLAHGTTVSHGRRVVFTEARMTDEDGRNLATASSTLLVLDR